jgi:hypothetical protein
MKKLAILGSTVAVALTAMPALGAFADVTDTVTVTINGACSVGGTTATTGAGVSLSETMTNGTTKVWEADGTAGGKLVVSCNDASGWNIKAVGASTGTSSTSMTPTGSGTAIATGTATSGATSNWAFKVAGTGAVAAYTSFAAVPGTATKVAGGSTTVSAAQINTGYQVYVSATQQADTYTGKVTYTVATGVGS